MVRIPIREVATKLRRSEAWVATELHAAGIRATDHIYSLSIDELEALPTHLRKKWSDRQAGAAASPATKGTQSTLAVATRGSRQPASSKRPSLTPAEQREVALALSELPEDLKAKLRGPKRQLQISFDEVRTAAEKKSSRNLLHAQIIRFVRTATFAELTASLEAEASTHDSSRPGQRHLGVAVASQPRTPHLERNPMAIFSRLPTDWWREQE